MENSLNSYLKDLKDNMEHAIENENSIVTVSVKDLDKINLLINKINRMDVAIAEMNRMKENIINELKTDEEIQFEELGWKEVLVAELSIYEKYLTILKD